MSEPSVNRDSPIVNVPFDEKGDYTKEIIYSHEFDWTSDDKRAIEEIINKFYNARAPSEEEIVRTSFGEVSVTQKIHPTIPRARLIQGFLLNSNKPSKMSNTLTVRQTEEQDNFSIIMGMAPEPISSNKDATDFLDKLIDQIRLCGIPSDEFKLEVFPSILSSLESVADRHISDQSSKERISYLVKIVKTYFPNNCDGK